MNSDLKVQGTGDVFKAWCARMGRGVPPDSLIDAMNRDSTDAVVELRRILPEHPDMYRAYCSFTAGKGRKRV